MRPEVKNLVAVNVKLVMKAIFMCHDNSKFQLLLCSEGCCYFKTNAILNTAVSKCSGFSKRYLSSN